MRKHLQSGRITNISQKDFDRIIYIDIEGYDELGNLTVKQLIVEIMGRHSNIILLDKQSNRIIDSIKRISGDVNRHRELLPGRLYIEPPTQDKDNPLCISLDDLKAKMNEFPHGTTISTSVYSSLQGISPIAAREICIRSKVDPDFVLTRLTEANFIEIFNSLKEILEQVRSIPTPVIIQAKDAAVMDFYCMELHSYSQLYETLKFDSMSDAIEKFYYKKDIYERLKQKSIDLRKFATTTLEKLYKKKQKLFTELKESTNASKYQLLGELIISNLHKISAGMCEIEVENYYDESNSLITISLDSRLSPSKNAQQYFKKYLKSKKAIIEIKKQLEEVEVDINYFENIIQSMENATIIDDIEEIRLELISEGYLKRKVSKKNKNKPPKKPLCFTSSDGFTILVGKNNTQNDILTLKTAIKTDYWFHTKDIPGSHVVLVTNNSTPSDVAIMEAAELAAFFSKGKLSSKVPVDYTIIKNVKKPSGAKPGMVIYENHKTIFVTPPSDVTERTEA